MDPLVFEPYLRPQPWGGRRLATRLGKRLPPEGTFGESWELSAHPMHVSRVAEEPLQGTTLAELCQRRSQEIFGPQATPATPFPLLVKYLDCHELLSVQVHPDDRLARELLGEPSGKTEAWVVIDAEPAARIYAGLRPGTTCEEIQQRLDEGTVAECLHAFQPRPGECVFLPAGTVHAAGGGVLVAEVQQPSDATLRMFDWNRVGLDGRPRPLHQRQAMAAIDWSAGPVKPVASSPLEGLPAGVRGEHLVTCPYFRLDRFVLDTPAAWPLAPGFSVWMLLDGSAELSSRGGAYRRMFRTGQTVLVPAAAEGFQWSTAGQSIPAVLLRIGL